MLYVLHTEVVSCCNSSLLVVILRRSTVNRMNHKTKKGGKKGTRLALRLKLFLLAGLARVYRASIEHGGSAGELA